jgi:GTPase SAR1 family protein
LIPYTKHDAGHYIMDANVDETRLKTYLHLHANPELNIFVLGAPGSGKRSVCSRIADDVFPQGRDPTEDGTYRRLIQLFPPEEPVEQGRKKFLVISNWMTILADPTLMHPDMLRGLVRAHEAFVLVYRTTERRTFEAVEGLWRNWIAGMGKGEVFVVANGGDEGEDGVDIVSEDEGRKMAERIGAAFWSLSAKTGEGAGEEQIVNMTRAIILHRVRRNGAE